MPDDPWTERDLSRLLALFSRVAEMPARAGGRGQPLLMALAEELKLAAWNLRSPSWNPLSLADPFAPAECLRNPVWVWEGHGFIWRAYRDRPFTEGESRLAATVLKSSPWLGVRPVAKEEPEESAPAHPMRLAQTLRWLMEGASRKEIAAGMGISVNTVAGYVRDLYRYYEVHTHGELIVALTKATTRPQAHGGSFGRLPKDLS